jgi:hypothetical protein
VTAPESLTYGRHAISVQRQQWKDELYALDGWLILHYHAVQVVIVALGVVVATTVAFAVTEQSLTAVLVGLVGVFAIAVGVAVKAMGSAKS